MAHGTADCGGPEWFVAPARTLVCDRPVHGQRLTSERVDARPTGPVATHGDG